MSEEVPEAVLEALNRISDKLDSMLEKMEGADLRLAKIEEYIGELAAHSSGSSGGAIDILRRLEAIERHLGFPQVKASPRQPKSGIH